MMGNTAWRVIKWCNDHFGRIMILLGLYLVVGFVQLPIQFMKRQSSFLVNLFWFIVYFLGFALAIWMARTIYFRYGYRHPHKLRWKDMELVVGCYTSAIVIEMVLNQLNFMFNRQVTSVNQKLIIHNLQTSHFILIAMVISMVCLSPILEELVFRGYLMDAFFAPRFFWLPVIISGVVFASGHLTSNFISFAVYVVLGMFLAYLYRKTGNLWASILMHAFNNLISVIPIVAMLLH